MYSDRKKQGQEGKVCVHRGAARGRRGGDRHNGQEVETFETAQSKHDRGHL